MSHEDERDKFFCFKNKDGIEIVVFPNKMSTCYYVYTDSILLLQSIQERISGDALSAKEIVPHGNSVGKRKLASVNFKVLEKHINIKQKLTDILF